MTSKPTLLGLQAPPPRATPIPRSNTMLGIPTPAGAPPVRELTLTDIRYKLFALTEDAMRAIDEGHPHRAKLLVRDAQALCRSLLRLELKDSGR